MLRSLEVIDNEGLENGCLAQSCTEMQQGLFGFGEGSRAGAVSVTRNNSTGIISCK